MKIDDKAEIEDMAMAIEAEGVSEIDSMDFAKAARAASHAHKLLPEVIARLALLEEFINDLVGHERLYLESPDVFIEAERLQALYRQQPVEGVSSFCNQTLHHPTCINATRQQKDEG